MLLPQEELAKYYSLDDCEDALKFFFRSLETRDNEAIFIPSSISVLSGACSDTTLLLT